MIAEAEGYQEADGIYPDNMRTVEIFDDMVTQWRVGMSGATGLDYSALPAVFEIRGVTTDEKEDIFNDLKIMERAALKAMSKK